MKYLTLLFCICFLCCLRSIAQRELPTTTIRADPPAKPKDNTGPQGNGPTGTGSTGTQSTPAPAPLTTAQKIEEEVKRRMANLNPAEKLMQSQKGTKAVEDFIREQVSLEIMLQEKSEREARERAEAERRKKDAEFKKKQEESNSDRSGRRG